MASCLAAIICAAFILQAGIHKPDRTYAEFPVRQQENTLSIKEKSTGTDSTGQWGISAIMATEAWKITSGKAGTIIAVLDTGIDEEHEDLSGQVIDKANFTSSPTTKDVYGHGTHIAGIIASKNNDYGITGVAYNCRLLNVKVADDGGWLDEHALAKGIRWAVDHEARVINISLYTLKESRDVEEAVDYAWSNGVLIVGSSGNGVGEKAVYPASYDNCMAVAATNSDNEIPAWSGIGKWVNMAAPGVAILSTMPDNRYERKSGTSMASAYAAGVAGLLYSLIPEAANRSSQNSLIRTIIKNSCGTSDTSSIGHINALKAVQAMISQQGSR